MFTDLYLVDNHFSSTPDARVGQRTEQAAYDAAIVAALQAADPNVRITVGGDLNVYPRPDDAFSPGSPLFPSDQLHALYDQGLTNLFDVLAADVPASAYSYVFQGQAQTLDQMFVTPSSLDELVKMRAAHINSDWPNDYEGDGPRGTSDHDPQVAQYSLLPSLDRLEDLVKYYDAQGAIKKNAVTKLLLQSLEQARFYLDRGQIIAYRVQLRVFIVLVRAFSPQFISRPAANALIQETQLLLDQPAFRSFSGSTLEMTTSAGTLYLPLIRRLAAAA